MDDVLTALCALGGAAVAAVVIAGSIAVKVGGWLAAWRQERVRIRRREAVSVRGLVRR